MIVHSGSVQLERQRWELLCVQSCCLVKGERDRKLPQLSSRGAPAAQHHPHMGWTNTTLLRAHTITIDLYCNDYKFIID